MTLTVVALTLVVAIVTTVMRHEQGRRSMPVILRRGSAAQAERALPPQVVEPARAAERV